MYEKEGGKTMNAGLDAVRERLDAVFRRRFGIDPLTLDSGARSSHLLGAPWRLEARDLLYLFFDVEREFAVSIPQERIADGRFSTLEGIERIVYDRLQERMGDPAVERPAAVFAGT
jgi:peptide maturation system acyl carrier-related protein